MKQIKVVGDIWVGKYQPALTGNRIVDTAVLTQFSVKLATWLSGRQIKLPIHIEHEFQPDSSQTDTLYLIDTNIIKSLSETALQSVNYLPVKHQDLLHANPTEVFQTILSKFKLNFNIQQS